MLQSIFEKLQFGIKYSFKDSACNVLTRYHNWYLLPLDYLPLLKGRKIEYKLKNGLKLIVRNNTFDLTILNEILIYNQYLNLLKEDGKVKIIIDIGAHIGTFSILSSVLIGQSKIYCYEPVQDNFDILRENIRINNLEERIFPHKTAVGKEEEKRTLYVSKNNTGGHSFYSDANKSKYYKKISVKTISLNHILKNFKTKDTLILKMDCEGAEYEILLNTSTKSLKKIKQIILEYHQNQAVQKLATFLQEKGFKVNIKKTPFPLLTAHRNN